MRAFGVFEGGGVRGYAHIGALSACENRGIDFIGVAGTSIGAIVAALVAVGYRSHELYALDHAGHETGLFAGDPVRELLDPLEFGRLDRFRSWQNGCARIFGRARASASNLFGRPGSRGWGDARWIWRSSSKSLEASSAIAPLAYAAALSFMAPHWRLLRTIWNRSGALDSRLLVSWLNERMAERLGMPGATITFSHVPIHLAFIATNLSRGTMTTFDRQTDPNMAVAEAAVASASYPFVLTPSQIGGDLFVDGGLVSNFPAWALDAARAELDTAVPTFGFRVVDELAAPSEAWPGSASPHPVEVLRRIIGTAMRGRGNLESRRIDDLHPMEVQTKVKATDFHAIHRERLNLFRKGKEGVEAYFTRELGPRDPVEMELRLRRLVDVIRDATGASGTLRAYVIQAIDEGFARVVYSALYEGDADDALRMRFGSASQVLCLERREPVLMRVRDLNEAQARSPSVRQVHALRPATVTHAYCVPMFGDKQEWLKPDPASRSVPLAALCVDFDHADDLLLIESHVEDVLAAASDALVDLWLEKGYVERDTAADEPFQDPPEDWSPVDDCPGFYVSDRKVRNTPPDELMRRIELATL